MVNLQILGFATLLSCLSSALGAQNDKQVVGDAVLTPLEIDSGAKITYLIRFENLTGATVANVVISDTLDARLDLSTLEMLDASHDFSLVRDDGPVVRWYFNDIQLPTQGTGGITFGYVYFQIRPKPFLNPGQVIPNRATIAFDQTDTIVTEDALVWIDGDSALSDVWADDVFNYDVVPNPNYGSFGLIALLPGQTASTSTSGGPPAIATAYPCWITDIAGRVVWTGTTASASAIELKQPHPGLYWLWIRDGVRAQSRQFIVAR